PCHRLGTSCHAQFGVDASRMGLDRMQRDEQLFGDLLIRATLGNQPQYRQLAIAQHGLVTRAWRIVRITLELQQSLTQAFALGDRKSTRLNSSHVKISYAVFCLKKKNKKKPRPS